MRITEYLESIAAEWQVATGLSLGRLGVIVVNDGKFFDRLAAGTQPRTATFEKFLAFFRDGKNWPHGIIPQKAVDLLERLENIADDGAAATGQARDASPAQADAA